MPQDPPWDIITEADGLRYRLHPDLLPGQRIIGVCLVIAALIAAIAIVVVHQGRFVAAAQTLANGTVLMPLILPLAFPVAFLIGCALGFRFACLIAWGRCEVRVRHRAIVGTWRAGPFRITRKARTDEVTRVVVETGLLQVNDKPVRRGRWGDAANLALEVKGSSPETGRVMLVRAYPSATIQRLADQIALTIGSQTATVLAIARVDAGESIDTSPRPQPGSSKATLERTAEGCSIHLPPMGYFKGSKGLGCFAILWLSFVTLFASLSISTILRSTGPNIMLLPFAGVSLVFGAIGIGMVVFSVRAGRRTAVIDIIGDDLLITRRSVGSAVSQTWHRDEIDRVTVGPSGMEVNDSAVLELQVWPKVGKKAGFFAERNDDELRWLAAEIRTGLRLDPPAPSYPPASTPPGEGA